LDADIVHYVTLPEKVAPYAESLNRQYDVELTVQTKERSPLPDFYRMAGRPFFTLRTDADTFQKQVRFYVRVEQARAFHRNRYARRRAVPGRSDAA
jgi:hypothetical protein